MSRMQLVNVGIRANNVTVPIVSGSVNWTEGRGEQDFRVVDLGEDETDLVFVDKTDGRISDLMFSMPSTPDTIQSALDWKDNGPNNVFNLIGTTKDGKRVARAFQFAAVVNNYQVNAGDEADIEIEIKSSPAI